MFKVTLAILIGMTLSACVHSPNQTNKNQMPESGRSVASSADIIKTEFVVMDPEYVAIDLDPEHQYGFRRQYLSNERVIFSFCKVDAHAFMNPNLERPLLDERNCRVFGDQNGYPISVLKAAAADIKANAGSTAFKKLGYVGAAVIGGAAGGYGVGRVFRMKNPFKAAMLGQASALAFVLINIDEGDLNLAVALDSGRKIQHSDVSVILIDNQLSPQQLADALSYLERKYLP